VRWAQTVDVEVAFVPAVGDFVATGATVALVTGPPSSEAEVVARVRIGPVRTWNRVLPMASVYSSMWPCVPFRRP
jgi:hypothetical protein